MDDLVTYREQDGVTIITLDDGKVNVLSPSMLAQINKALDRAESSGSVVVLAGRPGIFSGGFDLKVMRGGAPLAGEMLTSGFDLAERILSFPAPFVVAVTGHAIAMGTFLSLCGDYRVGINGPYRIVINEVAIGMTLPKGTIEICRMRLTPSHFTRALTLAEPFSGKAAVKAGFFDHVVSEGELIDHVTKYATQLTALHRDSFIATKRRVRAEGVAAVHRGFEADARERSMMGL